MTNKTLLNLLNVFKNSEEKYFQWNLHVPDLALVEYVSRLKLK